MPALSGTAQSRMTASGMSRAVDGSFAGKVVYVAPDLDGAAAIYALLTPGTGTYALVTPATGRHALLTPDTGEYEL